MITISLCMIVRNEELVLARCLDSVQGIPDEIIIVDTGSVDATKEIAGQYTSLVYDFLWQDDFSAARNFSFSKASKEYLLWLDADDVLSPKDREAFLNLKNQLDPTVDIVMMPYIISEDPQGNSLFSYPRERLIKREKGYVWQGEIHETISLIGIIRQENIPVRHRKMKSGDPKRNLRIFQGMISRGKQLDPRERYYYARELWYNEQYASAKQELETYLTLPGWKEDRIQAWLILSHCRSALGDEAGALDCLYKSFEEDLPRPEVCCAIGDWYQRQGENQKAVYWYRMAMEAPESEMGFCQPEMKTFVPLMQMCVCYDRLGDRKQAFACHQQAKKLHPEHPSVLYNEKYFQSLLS
ncbi:MAG: glycosyltransferase [Massiliimalia sp.]|jgi:tetratricopeptide (TPR) repeat protein